MDADYLIEFVQRVFLFGRDVLYNGFSSDSNIVNTVHCDECPHLREQLKENKMKFEKTLDDERKKNFQLSENYEKLKQRSDLVTDYMSKVMLSNDDIEDMSNQLSNSKIAERFGQIRKNEWRRLFKFIENKSGDEVETLHKISTLLKDVYGKCKVFADSKVRLLASLGDYDDLPDKTEFRDVYRCRRIYGQKQHARDTILLRISEECLQTFPLSDESGCSANETNSENVNGTESSKTDSEVTNAAKRFIEECVDCCWLMVISQPNIELSFDVVGKIFTQSMEESFMKYSTQANVTDTRPVGTIVSLVWPKLDDSHGTHTRGIVVTVDNCRH